MQTTFLFFLFVNNICSQVVIEERVEINSQDPSNTVNKILTELCETYLPDFKIPANNDNELYNVFHGNCEENWGVGVHCFCFIITVAPVNVAIINGDEFVRCKLWDPITQTYSDPGSNFTINGSTSLYLIFDQQQPDSVATTTITFSKTGFYASYSFNVHKPIFHLESWGDLNDIDYGTEQLVKILGTNQCGRGPRIPSSVLYSVEIIEGDEFGQLHNPETDEYGSSLNSLHNSGRFIQDFYFVAYGIIPDEDAQIIIRIETTDPEIEPINVSFLVKPPQLVVSLEPSEISAGATAQVVIKKREPDGTLVDFDSTQTFEIAKLEGCVLGDILIGSDSGAYFYNVSQPIYFTVADSINGDSSQTVLLRIGLVEEEKSIPEIKQQHLENYECFWDEILSNIYQDKLFEVGPKIELLSYANGEPKLWIDGDELTMPEFPVQLKITNDTRGNFDFLRYYLFLEWKNTQQTGQPVYGGGVTKLEQLPPGGSPLIFDFNVDWDHPNPGFICGGDELTLRIEYKGVKKNFKLNTDILGDNPVDKETFRTYVSTKLTDPKDKHMNVVLYFETQFRQFWTDHYVYMNTDNPPEVDWGVCQVRKITPTIGEIWNWKENINSGIDIFNKKYNEAINYPPNQRTEKRWKRWYKIIYNNLTDFTTDEQKFKETHHLYRGGHYWHWFPVDEQNPDSQGEWKPDPQNNHNRGEDAWIIYQRVKNNDPPEGWNN